MVSLQELHSGNTFRCPNVSATVGLKAFCPWCLKLGRNTKTIVIHLQEVHYRKAIICEICWAFAGMSAQSILDHHFRCKAKCDKECVEHEGPQNPKEKEVFGTKRNIPVTWSRCCQAVIRSGMSLYIFCPVKLI